MKELYERIETSREESDVQVRLSYLEIYNESLRDLLSPLPTPPGQGLMLREDAAKKMSVVGITEHIPESPERVLEMIQEGNMRRTMSPTEANEVSSRSHAVLQINVTQRPRTADTITETTSASLNIIDLAGSERAAATRNNGARMKEGANINKSLLALGNCINALCQSGGQRSRHVPYRNSKLTRLLKFSLGGNCKTVMIVCVSPSSAHYDETQNTLKYANQAKNIRTKVSRNMLNVDRHVAQYVQAIHELREEVAELKAKLAERGTLESATEKRKRIEMVKEMQEAKAKMKESTESIKKLVHEQAGVEAHLAAAGTRLASLRQRLSQIDVDMQSQQATSKDLESERNIVVRMAAKEEAILQDENLLSTVRNLNNSLQIQRGIIVAASQNTKFDTDTAELIRTFGDCMLAEIEILRSNIKYESLKCAFDMGAPYLAELVTLSTQTTFALKEATLAVEAHTQAQQAGEGGSLALLVQQMHNVCNDNEDVFNHMVGTTTMALHGGDSSALRRAAGRKSVTSTRQSVPQERRRSSVAGTSIKALLPTSSPRKAMMRRSTAGPRRSGVQANQRVSSHGRRFSSNAASAPKKSFRWADEAGEGRIDDHDRRSASPPHVRIKVPSNGDRGAAVSASDHHHVTTQSAKWKDRASLLRAERDSEVGHSSGTEWEDESKEVGGVVKREGRLFERNFLAKKEAKPSTLGEESDADTSSNVSVRAPFSELGNGVVSEPSSDDYTAQEAVEYSPMSIRSSPYSRRTSQLGPVRRKTRSSLGDCSTAATKTSGGGNPIRLATGPPSFTASRSGRTSNNNAMSASTVDPIRKITPANHQFKPTAFGTPTTSSIHSNGHAPPTSANNHRNSSNSGTAWR